MIKYLLVVAGIACVASNIWAQDSDRLGSLQKSFMARYDALNERTAKSEEQLSASYIAALGRLQIKLQKTGKIEVVLPVKEEITNIKTRNSDLPEIPPTAHPELVSLRQTYTASRSKIRVKHAEDLVQLSAKMIKLLDDETKSLTKEGKIDEATAAKRMAESLEEDPKIVASRELLAEEIEPVKRVGKVPGWQPLMTEPFEIDGSGEGYVGPLKGDGGKGLDSQGLGKYLNTLTEKPENVLMACSPCRVVFTPEGGVSSVKARLYVHHEKANFSIVVRADKKVVLEKQINGAMKDEEIVLDFRRSARLAFEFLDLDGIPLLDSCALFDLQHR